MQVQLIGSNYEIDDKTRAMVDEVLVQKLDKLLQDMNEDMKHAAIKIEKSNENQEYTVDFDLWLPGKHHVFAQKHNYELSTAFVHLREAVEQQIEKFMEKIKSH